MKISLSHTYKINTGNYESMDVSASIELHDTEVGMDAEEDDTANVLDALQSVAEEALQTLLEPSLEKARALAKQGNPRSIAFKIETK